ncbi:MAG: glucose-6-phosphate isomerase [Alphaproteobacteria bacterium]
MSTLYTQNLALALKALQATEADLTALLLAAAGRIETFVEEVGNDAHPTFNSALHSKSEVVRAVSGWHEKFEHVVLLGMGGSSLGARVIAHFADAANLRQPRLHLLDYIDPVAVESVLSQLPLNKTGVVVISKSGGTLETMAQALLLAEAYTTAKVKLANHWVAVTEEKNNPLRQFAAHHKIPTLAHHAALGGRYSVSGETGVLAALVKGVDVPAFHTGMRHVMNTFLENPISCPPAMGAALHALAKTQGKTNTVLYSYGESFRFVPAWFEQLWAESLGKNGQGTTPVGAVGPGSQHSIQQLFLDGPADKLFTVLLPLSAGWGKEIPVPANPFVPALNGLHLGTLQQAMGEGTVAALAARKHPVRTLTVAKLNAQTLGAILMHFMLETVLTAAIWGINPFDQPAVEESKQQSLKALAALQKA